jgi:predicted transposase/invertase (TIGR01784 family)
MPYVTGWERIVEKRGIRVGKREGKREGIREMKVETAKRMLDDNFSIESISRYTGLEENEIRSLMDLKEAKYSSTRVSKTSH